MSRWDDLSGPAHQMLADFDELDLADIAASATAAVQRVRALHRPVDYNGRTICAECSAWDGGCSTDNSPVLYDQCRTLRALNNPEAP